MKYDLFIYKKKIRKNSVKIEFVDNSNLFHISVLYKLEHKKNSY